MTIIWSAVSRPTTRGSSQAPPSPGKSELPLDDRTLQIVELCDGRRGVEQVVEVSPNNKRDSTAYDVAGNAILRVTRRGDSLYTHFDTLNRVHEEYAG